MACDPSTLRTRFCLELETSQGWLTSSSTFVNLVLSGRCEDVLLELARFVSKNGYFLKGEVRQSPLRSGLSLLCGALSQSVLALLTKAAWLSISVNPLFLGKDSLLLRAFCQQ